MDRHTAPDALQSIAAGLVRQEIRVEPKDWVGVGCASASWRQRGWQTPPA
jgi:hypothetical protein